MEDDYSGSVLWFVAGAAIGASIAILFAPASGDETRGLIAKKTSAGRDALTESGNDMMDRGRELFDRARKLTDEAADMFDKGRKLVDNTAANLQQG